MRPMFRLARTERSIYLSKRAAIWRRCSGHSAAPRESRRKHEFGGYGVVVSNRFLSFLQIT